MEIFNPDEYISFDPGVRVRVEMTLEMILAYLSHLTNETFLGSVVQASDVAADFVSVDGPSSHTASENAFARLKSSIETCITHNSACRQNCSNGYFPK